MAGGITCLVTVHGIGFQEPPREGVPGYADDLHAHLHAQLKDELSDDPLRQAEQVGGSVPIYMRSRWPVEGGSRDAGYQRLGVWINGDHIDASKAPLVKPGSNIAHVALVYANLEDLGPQPEATTELIQRGIVEHSHYAPILSIMHTALSDGLAALQHQGGGQPSTGGNMVRTDVDSNKPQGLLATVRQVEDDVAGYVARNDLRERIRTFVGEAFLRLGARDDVERIVVNSHSNGTVISYDVLRNLDDEAAAKVALFITAGSPLRKYADFFAWGTEVGNIRRVGAWRNYFDAKDPVADPLSGLFVSEPADATETQPQPLADVVVDNLAHSSGGGLQAHNYWDNDQDFITPLADALRS